MSQSVVLSSTPSKAHPAVTPPKHSCAADTPRYRLFFLCALGIMVAAGGAWGTMLLIKYAAASRYTGLSLFEMNAHGHLMLSGFIGLFIMGFAYQAFPNLFRHPIVLPRMMRAVCLLMVAGLCCTACALIGHSNTWAWWLGLAGHGMECVATLLFTFQLATTYVRGRMPFDPHIAFIFAACLFMVIAAGFSGWLDHKTLLAESRMEVVYYVSTYQPALRNFQLHGFTLLMILGVAHRLMTNFYVLQRTSGRMMFVALGLMVVSVFAEAGLFVAFRLTESVLFAKLLMLPWAGLIAGTLIVAWRWRLWRRPVDQMGRTDRMAAFVRASFAWLAVALAMMVLLPLWSKIVGTYFSHAFYGASRHAFVFGFATMLIVAFTLRVVPNLNGVVPTGLPAMRGAFWTLNLGCALHIGAQVLGEPFPAFHLLLPAAGVIELLGIVLWCHHLGTLMQAGAARKSPAVPVQRRATLAVLQPH